MADDNKPMKYMRYAIGEIVLVVIGILIALSINNWNEENKVNNEIAILSKSMISDLESDIKQFDVQIKRNDSIINNLLIVNDVVAKADNNNNFKEPILSLFKFTDFRPNNATYKSIVSNNYLGKYDNSIEKHVISYYEQTYHTLSQFIQYQREHVDKLTDVIIDELPSFLLSDEEYSSKSLGPLSNDRVLNLLTMNQYVRESLQLVLKKSKENAQKLITELESNYKIKKD